LPPGPLRPKRRSWRPRRSARNKPLAGSLTEAARLALGLQEGEDVTWVGREGGQMGLSQREARKHGERGRRGGGVS
jgi:hypothetical protein